MTTIKTISNQQREVLTPCEEMVMIIIWESYETLSMQEITERANNRFEMDWKPQTISTFLARIVRKGYLDSYRSGRVFYYIPLISKEEYLKDKLTYMSELFRVSKDYLKSLM